jgi:hypothetical protein
VIRVSRKVPAANQVRKARRIVESGRAVSFTGPGHRLDEINDLLRGAEGISTFLGDDGTGEPVLIVEPANDDDVGCIVTDRV